MWTNKSLPPHITAVNTNEMTRKEWEEFRGTLTTLGGSDVGTCVGLNRWKSNIELFYEKLKLYKKNFNDSVPMMMGRELEHNIRGLFKYYDVENPDALLDNYHNGNAINVVRQRHATFFNEKFPELHANIDGIVKLQGREGFGILEIKYQSGQAVRLWENGINPSYLIQIMAYMRVTGLQYGVLCTILDANQWKVHVIERDDDMWNNHIYPLIQDFHERLRTAQIELEGIRDEEERVNLAWHYEPQAFEEQAKPYEAFLSEYAKRRETELVMEGDEKLFKMAFEADQLSKASKQAENAARNAKNAVRSEMLKQGASVATFGDKGSVTYRKHLRINIK